ncbi:hypothetical protein F132_8 [Flavobacterium sp. phage 1/32]|nr:hypothetical protein F132_8 [Flavobacterium sp. phage 1/32]
MKNKAIVLTPINHFGKTDSFRITVVLIPEILYYQNNQEEVKANIKKFGIKEEKPQEKETRVVFSRFDGNCIITFSFMVGKKIVRVQLLVKEGLNQDALINLLTDIKNERFLNFKDALLQAIELNKEDVLRREQVK